MTVESASNQLPEVLQCFNSKQLDLPKGQVKELTMCVNKVLGMARSKRKYSLCNSLPIGKVVLIYKISRDLEWPRLKCSSEILGRGIIVVRINSGVMRAGVREPMV